VLSELRLVEDRDADRCVADRAGAGECVCFAGVAPGTLDAHRVEALRTLAFCSVFVSDCLATLGTRAAPSLLCLLHCVLDDTNPTSNDIHNGRSSTTYEYIIGKERK